MSQKLIKIFYFKLIIISMLFSNFVFAKHNYRSHHSKHKYYQKIGYVKNTYTKTKYLKITKYSKNFKSTNIRKTKTKITTTYTYRGRNISKEKAAVVAWINKNRCSRSTKNIHQIVNSSYNYSLQKGLDPTLVIGQMKQESCFNTKAVSFAGARGLLQVIPRWHRDKIKGRNLYNAPVGIDVGTSVLKEYMTNSRNNTCRALRTYSGGANNYCKLVMSNRAKLNKFIYSYRYNVASNN